MNLRDMVARLVHLISEQNGLIVSAPTCVNVLRVLVGDGGDFILCEERPYAFELSREPEYIERTLSERPRRYVYAVREDGWDTIYAVPDSIELSYVCWRWLETPQETIWDQPGA